MREKSLRSLNSKIKFVQESEFVFTTQRENGVCDINVGKLDKIVYLSYILYA